MQIYQALGWQVPVMAHVPLIHGPDGAKLSKRHGALGVDAYRAMGYLPKALRNYLVRLGWSQGDKEFFTTKEMVEAFDLEQIGRSSARFDFVKLENMNGYYIRASDDDDLLAALESALPHLPEGAALLRKLDPAMRERLRAAIPGLKERAKTLVELLDGAKFLFAERPLALDVKAASILDATARKNIAALIPRFEAVSDWDAASLEAIVRDYVAENKIKLGDAAQPLRSALTGRAISPGIFDVLEVLGREESIARLQDQAG
jgi:glutamyl-tRNA synthetase